MKEYLISAMIILSFSFSIDSHKTWLYHYYTCYNVYHYNVVVHPDPIDRIKYDIWAPNLDENITFQIDSSAFQKCYLVCLEIFLKFYTNCQAQALNLAQPNQDIGKYWIWFGPSRGKNWKVYILSLTLNLYYWLWHFISPQLS